jgi:hypothetical protein
MQLGTRAEHELPLIRNLQDQEIETERNDHVPHGVELGVRKAEPRQRETHEPAKANVHEPSDQSRRVETDAAPEQAAHDGIRGTPEEAMCAVDRK